MRPPRYNYLISYELYSGVKALHVTAAYLAVLNLDAEPDVRARAVSAAKATVGRAARFIGQNAVQLHGGMGMTEELAIGHYFKRLTALQYEFGSTDYHRARYAKLTRPTN